MKDYLKMPQTIAFVGLGQMGGSLARSVAKNIPNAKLLAYSPFPEEQEELKNSGLFQLVSDKPEEIVGQADFTFLSQPIPVIIDFVENYVKDFKKGSIVTDISSIKSDVIDAVRPLFAEQGIHFIGSHPMAGSEKSGFANSSNTLYDNAVTFVCSFCTDDPAAINIVREVWRELNCRPVEIDAIVHDDVVAHSSHMLHLFASSITKVVLGSENSDITKLACAGGFRDSSRIASSNPKMWAEVTQHNSRAILNSIDQTLDELSKVQTMIKEQNWNGLEGYLAESKELRDDWWQSKNQEN